MERVRNCFLEMWFVLERCWSAQTRWELVWQLFGTLGLRRNCCAVCFILRCQEDPLRCLKFWEAVWWAKEWKPFFVCLCLLLDVFEESAWIYPRKRKQSFLCRREVSQRFKDQTFWFGSSNERKKWPSSMRNWTGEILKENPKFFTDWFSVAFSTHTIEQRRWLLKSRMPIQWILTSTKPGSKALDPHLICFFSKFIPMFSPLKPSDVLFGPALYTTIIIDHLQFESQQLAIAIHPRSWTRTATLTLKKSLVKKGQVVI